MFVNVSEVHSQHNEVLIGIFYHINMRILDAFNKENGGLGDQRKFIQLLLSF